MPSLELSIPFTPQRRSLSDVRLYTFAAAFALGNLLLPMAVHRIPNGGQIFLPLFFFTLVAAWSEGLAAGLLVAVASPLINHAVTGMPAPGMLPIVLFKSLFLAVTAATLSRSLGRISLSLIAAVIVAMQVLGALVELTLLGSPARVGQALAFAPLSAVATAGIEAENAGSASALFNMLRNLGGAFGIAVSLLMGITTLMATFVARPPKRSEITVMTPAWMSFGVGSRWPAIMRAFDRAKVGSCDQVDPL